MAKTRSIHCKEIAGWQHVSHALHKAAKGKTSHIAVKAALKNPEQTIKTVSSALAMGGLPKGSFNSFEIYDPKKRVIHAAPFLDRIAHHAIIMVLEPSLERVLLPSVFACRPNKGVHKAIFYAQKQSRRFKWVMHVDIKHYFPNIDHAVLKHQLRKRFRGDALSLVDVVIDAYHSEKGIEKGLPIGSLTSQHFANHYLNEADRWCLRQKGIKAHCRYMDDFLFWANDRKSLLNLSHALSDYLAVHLKLTIKPPKIQPARQFLLFCGIKIRPFQLRASHRRKQRYKLARSKWERRWAQGDIDSTQLQNAYATVQAILLPAISVSFRENELLQQGYVDA